MIDKLKQWSREADAAGNCLAATFIRQVADAYQEDVRHRLISGDHAIRVEVDKLSDCKSWSEFFDKTYDPRHPVHNLSQVALW